MNDRDRLAERFEAHRGRLRGVAYRILGSLGEAEDAVQEAWLRLGRADAGEIENLGGWLTTVVARVSLDMLRSRQARREEPLELHAPGPDTAGPDTAGPDTPGPDTAGADTAGRHDRGDPAQEAALADSVGLALLVVLDRLPPAERVAFVLHDLFSVPFSEIAPIVERTPVAAKKLASRARHRVHGAPTAPAAEVARHRHVVEAFLAAARQGDIAGLLAVLDPDVVRRADPVALGAGGAPELRGARAVAEETAGNAARARFARPALVDGGVGAVVAPHGRLAVALRLTIAEGTIRAVDVVADPARLAQLDLAVLDPAVVGG